MTTRRLVGVWVLLAIVMSANGVFREAVLKDAMTADEANLASAVIGVFLILGVTRLFLGPLKGARRSTLIRVSAAFVVMTVAFEFAIGRLVDRKTWGELIENYALWRGHLWPIVLAVLAATPFLWSTRSSERQSPSSTSSTSSTSSASST